MSVAIVFMSVAVVVVVAMCRQCKHAIVFMSVFMASIPALGGTASIPALGGTASIPALGGTF